MNNKNMKVIEVSDCIETQNYAKEIQNRPGKLGKIDNFAKCLTHIFNFRICCCFFMINQFLPVN